MRKDSNAIPGSRPPDITVALLAWLAGSVDAIGYLGLGHVFTANMTGNTVLLGLALGQGQGWAALRSLLALAGFAAGAAIGAMIVERPKSMTLWRPSVTRALLVEGAVLATFTVVWHLPLFPRSAGVVDTLIALAGIAMGIQSATVHRLDLPGIATTYVTGTLTSLISGLVNRPGPARGGLHTAKAVDKAMHWEHSVRLQATVFLVYGFAAATSSLLQKYFPPAVALSPLVAIAIVVASALSHRRSPLAE